MKKMIAIFMACIICLSAVGCTPYSEADDVANENISFANGYFTKVKQWETVGANYCIVYANDTKVKYFIAYANYKFGITPLYNADGSLQVYEE